MNSSSEHGFHPITQDRGGASNKLDRYEYLEENRTQCK